MVVPFTSSTNMNPSSVLVVFFDSNGDVVAEQEGILMEHQMEVETFYSDFGPYITESPYKTNVVLRYSLAALRPDLTAT